MSLLKLLPQSLIARVSLAVFAVISICMLISYLYLHQTMYFNMENLLKAQHYSKAANISSSINRALQERLQGLEKAAKGARKALLTDTNAIQDLVEQRPVLQVMFNGGIIAYSVEGIVVADFPLSSKRMGSNYINIDAVATSLQEGRSSIGHPIISKKTQTAMFAIGAPIRDASGKVIGGLTGFVNFHIPSFIDEIATTDKKKTTEYILFSPQEKMVLTSIYKHQSMPDLSSWIYDISIDAATDGFEGNFYSIDPNGVERFTSLIAISETKWYLAITSPTVDVFSPLKEIKYHLSLITLSMIVLAGFFVWWIIKHQLSPIASAARSLEMISSKKRPLHKLPVINNDEVGQLITGFNQLLDTLRKREIALQDSQFFFKESQAAAFLGSYRSDFVIDEWETSEVCDQIFGIDNNYGKNIQGWGKLIHPDDVEYMLQYVTEEVIGKSKPFNKEYRIIRKVDGLTRWVHGLGETITDEDGTCIGLIGTIQDVTERKKTELALASERNLLNALIDNLPDLVWLKDKDGVYLRCNHRFEKFIGASNLDIVNKTDYDFVDKGLADSFRKHDCMVMEANKALINEEEVPFASDGHRELLETTKVPMHDDNGDLIGVLGIGHNITETKEANDQLKLAASVFTHAREGIIITDSVGSIIEVNETFSNITGYSRKEALGENPRFLQSGRQSPEFYASMWLSLQENNYWTGELWNRRKNGEVYAEIATISAVVDSDGTVQNYVALFTDITSIKEHQKQLEYMAHFDVLTSLPNRTLLADRLRQAISQSDKTQQSLAVVYLDLDSFKTVNDTYGHEVGDELLIIMSKRIKDIIRAGDTLARIGGDEFIAILVGIEDIITCEQILARMLQASMAPCNINNTILRTSASIGVTFYPQDKADADQLIRHADNAMYTSKQNGKNRYHIFDIDHDTAIKTHRESLNNIKRALKLKEFVLYYQPKVNMKTGKVISVEALIRWQHPDLGILSPGDFLPIIENHPISLSIGEWVIDTALTQVSKWQSIGLDISVSVNVSAYQLLEENFLNKLYETLAKHPSINPHCLELEILETSALDDIAKVSSIIYACRKIGVSFSLDDFGTGYSSLTYLKRLPADILKIDQSFVRDMLVDEDDRAIVQGVINLAAAFERQVIAEGVETFDHGAQLLLMGCTLAQGYGIARPMPAQEINEWVTQWQLEPKWTA